MSVNQLQWFSSWYKRAWHKKNVTSIELGRIWEMDQYNISSMGHSQYWILSHLYSQHISPIQLELKIKSWWSKPYIKWCQLTILTTCFHSTKCHKTRKGMQWLAYQNQPTTFAWRIINFSTWRIRSDCSDDKVKQNFPTSGEYQDMNLRIWRLLFTRLYHKMVANNSHRTWAIFGKKSKIWMFSGNTGCRHTESVHFLIQRMIKFTSWKRIFFMNFTSTILYTVKQEEIPCNTFPFMKSWKRKKTKISFHGFQSCSTFKRHQYLDIPNYERRVLYWSVNCRSSYMYQLTRSYLELEISHCTLNHPKS